jgi:hypothetical protein
MKAKEKAKELVFKIQVEEQKEHIYLFHMTLESAKRSALIAVDEILEQFNYIVFIEDAYRDTLIEYWHEVQLDINAL